MSYDVSLHATRPTTVFSSNYTYNCAPMFIRAIGQDGIKTLHGLKASEVIGQLERALAHITDPENISFYIELEPDNGWGSHAGATDYIREILEACQKNPDAIFDVG